MNDKIVKKTQDSLGKIIKKPPMTEKLLNKPPFRFLHDVITSVSLYGFQVKFTCPLLSQSFYFIIAKFNGFV